MTRVKRHSYGRTQVYISEAHNEIRGIEHNLRNLVDGFEAVHPADEFQIARAPGSVRSDVLLVTFNRLPCSRIIPGQRQLHFT
ncbi:hypothetical protein D3C80_1707520 [compost metagenome]